ncbi:hypothetical protein [Lederbergia citri]|uniref:Uncharacterized protein n=1 Tax=Lederbergia citri TaxID=2833580 RepID=A0A942YJH1_9BACI|nr:hypothetical protein [Lederbergia citri]MBS4196371.1 hypothetical protein [Lederbergia citri]
MTLNQVVRTFAIIGIIAAIANIASITYAYIDPETNVTNIINAFVSGLVFIGLICSYLVQTKELGGFGLISFIVLSIGFILVSGLEWTITFAGPVLESLSPSINFDNLPSPLIEGMAASFLTFNIGLLLFGISLLKSSKISRWLGFLFIIAIAANFAPPMDDKAWYFINISIIWICWKVWTRKVTAVSESANSE